MRRYEVIFIVNPDLSSEEMDSVLEKYKGIITSQKGSIIKLDTWGIMNMAYRIRKHTKGYYVLMDFVGGAAVGKELERNFKIDDRILRYLTVKIADKFEMAAPPREEAA